MPGPVNDAQSSGARLAPKPAGELAYTSDMVTITLRIDEVTAERLRLAAAEQNQRLEQYLEQVVASNAAQIERDRAAEFRQVVTELRPKAREKLAWSRSELYD